MYTKKIIFTATTVPSLGKILIKCNSNRPFSQCLFNNWLNTSSVKEMTKFTKEIAEEKHFPQKQSISHPRTRVPSRGLAKTWTILKRNGPWNQLLWKDSSITAKSTRSRRNTVMRKATMSLHPSTPTLIQMTNPQASLLTEDGCRKILPLQDFITWEINTKSADTFTGVMLNTNMPSPTTLPLMIGTLPVSKTSLLSVNFQMKSKQGNSHWCWLTLTTRNVSSIHLLKQLRRQLVNGKFQLKDTGLTKVCGVQWLLLECLQTQQHGFISERITNLFKIIAD